MKKKNLLYWFTHIYCAYPASVAKRVSGKLETARSRVPSGQVQYVYRTVLDNNPSSESVDKHVHSKKFVSCG